MKKNYCKICNEYSNKRKVCLKCKTNFTFRSAGKEGRPFNRKAEYEKEISKKEKDRGVKSPMEIEE